jgi:hypothetical protein
MVSLGAAAMGSGPLLQGLHEPIIDAAHQQISHQPPVQLITMIAAPLW